MRLRLNVLTAFAVFALPCVFAQTTGVIRGTVTDPSGAVIGGAKVTAILQGMNTNRTTTSDPRGEYVLPTLAVGKYTIEMEAPGFKKYVNRDLDVTIGHVIVADAS